MLTKAQAKLISLITTIAAGLHTLIGKVTMAHNTEEVLLADAAAVTDGSTQVAGAETALGGAVELRDLALAAAYDYLVKAALILRALLGAKPSALSTEAGWGDHTMATPREAELILPHLANLKAFLAKYPQYETTSQEFQLTAVRCTAIHKALRDAMTGDPDTTDAQNPNRVKGVAWHESNLQTKKDTLLATEVALKLRLHNFRNEFADVVKDPMSPYYITIGLPRPGETHPPAKVTNVRLTVLGGGQVHAEHDPVPDADHYVYRGKIVGTEERFRYFGSNGQPDYIAKKQPVGATLAIQVVAVNESGQQGPASEPAQIVVT